VPDAWLPFLEQTARRGYGFVRLGADDVAALRALHAEAAAFFARPLEEKQRHAGQEGAGLRNVGYMHRPDFDKELFTFRGVRAVESGEVDLADALRRLWPSRDMLARGADVLARLSQLAAAVAAVLLLDAGHALRAVLPVLEQVVPYRSVHAASLSNLTCFHYAPASPASYPCLPHTDVGLVTLIPLAGGGLSLWDLGEGRWLDVEAPRPGAEHLAVAFPGECVGFASAFVPAMHQVAWLEHERFSTPLQFLPARSAPVPRAPRTPAARHHRAHAQQLLLSPSRDPAPSDAAVLGADLVAAISAARTPQTFFKPT
jgi:isopenicillin N synthase-like dioxygenase